LQMARLQAARRARWVLPLAALAALYGCGGGGGGGSSGSLLGNSFGNGGSGSGTGSTYTPGVFQPSSKFAALCQSPRSGTESDDNNRTYSALQGTTTDVNNWLRCWTHELYLWYDEVQDADPSLSTTAQYFQLMKTMETTPSGAPKDRFHFTYATSVWEQLSGAGVEVDYGVQFEIVKSTPPRSVEIGYVETNIPTADRSQNLVRGDKVLAVDGADVVNATDQASINTINAGLSPAT